MAIFSYKLSFRCVKQANRHLQISELSKQRGCNYSIILTKEIKHREKHWVQIILYHPYVFHFIFHQCVGKATVLGFDWGSLDLNFCLAMMFIWISLGQSLSHNLNSMDFCVRVHIMLSHFSYGAEFLNVWL